MPSDYVFQVWLGRLQLSSLSFLLPLLSFLLPKLFLTSLLPLLLSLQLFLCKVTLPPLLFLCCCL